VTNGKPELRLLQAQAAVDLLEALEKAAEREATPVPRLRGAEARAAAKLLGAQAGIGRAREVVVDVRKALEDQAKTALALSQRRLRILRLKP
jgi:plasmid stabilization system protein ParE